MVFTFFCCCHCSYRNHFFRLYQQNKSFESKVNFRQASNHGKRVLEAAKHVYTNKTKESITSQKRGSRDFWRIANSVLNEGKSAILPLFNDPVLLSSASGKAKLFAKNVSKNSNVKGSVISLPACPSRCNLRLHNHSVTPKMVKKEPDSAKASGPDLIPVVVLKNREPELSCILGELFNMSKRVLVSRFWKVSLGVPVFKIVGERSTAKNYRPVSLFSVVSKVFEKLVNNGLLDRLGKCEISQLIQNIFDTEI